MHDLRKDSLRLIILLAIATGCWAAMLSPTALMVNPSACAAGAA